MLASDALLFVIPEYNRSIPGGVKNAIDVASKPTGQNCWSGKPALVVSQSTGPLGGLAGSYALKQALAAVNVATMPLPEVYLSRIATLFDGEGPHGSRHAGAPAGRAGQFRDMDHAVRAGLKRGA